MDLMVNEEAIPVVLSLLDQVHALLDLDDEIAEGDRAQEVGPEHDAKAEIAKLLKADV